MEILKAANHRLPKGEWTVSFKNEKGGKGDTIYFELYDRKSMVKVIKNNKDTLDNKGATVTAGKGYEVRYDFTGSEIYRVKIEAGITVTGEYSTGILLPEASSIQVYVSGQSLHVSTSVAKRVSVYTAGGQLLYSLDKPAGKASVSGLPKGILIVKGSSGWVEKAVVR
ncbi:MAG: hypothetical protein LBG45_00510 [Dysgonamonadaceae bacterium]|nr:hypothetical protein [Dysgonamonadaceae bacterium]